ncbi:hypothetical protein ASG11_10615 [Sphingomonas sp. Leaf357]|uniref:DUF6975 family protein n=1 Tax=Sphingomonas sp. Leaf357 TaxID=1736350 RepID=UPI0006FCEB90|nr:hypothetical protein [Sphingomonas sp. Leaf357]KQS04647.1 hypothetical protein ASG11_10615 [Sphingomonas sp. Leaf357]
MVFESAHLAQAEGSWGIIAALSAADGSGAHPMMRKLAARTAPLRDLADAVHALCMLHGRHPGVIEHAAIRNAQPLAQDWLHAASEAFTEERNYLAKLAVAAGHAPSTPGQAESEAAVIGQRHALEMLAQSDRAGCATGAATALLLDWATIRPTLDLAAHRFGITPPECVLPIDNEIATVIGTLGETPGVERAMAFGAQQLLAQHRGLWDLLEARASARDHL